MYHTLFDFLTHTEGTTYILVAPEGFGLSSRIGAPAGVCTAAVCLGLFFLFGGKSSPDDPSGEENPSRSPAEQTRE